MNYQRRLIAVIAAWAYLRRDDECEGVEEFGARLEDRGDVLVLGREAARLEVRAHEQPDALAAEAALFVKPNRRQDPPGQVDHGKVDARKLQVDRLQFTVGQLNDILTVEIL